MAVESGSRAWGFASPDSDYDVRFIYVRRNEDYLRLNPFKDVIELPINNILDINGWDLKKALTLFYKSNPTLFEWLNSPIVYMKTIFLDEIRNIACRYFSEKHSLYHYISMAQRNYNEYLKGDAVKVKKYFLCASPSTCLPLDYEGSNTATYAFFGVGEDAIAFGAFGIR